MCLALALPHGGCGPESTYTGRDLGYISHDMVEENRPASGVRRVEVDLPTAYKLQFEQGSDEGLWIRAEAISMYWFRTPVRQGVTHMGLNLDLGTALHPLPDREMVLTVRAFESVEAAGSIYCIGDPVAKSSMSASGSVVRIGE